LQLSHSPRGAPRTRHGPGFLHHLLALSSAGALTAYCVWAFGPRHDVWLASASVVTLTLLFLRCALVVDQPGGDAALERDHAPWALGLLWVALYVGAASV
jgi:hypothetical protein